MYVNVLHLLMGEQIVIQCIFNKLLTKHTQHQYLTYLYCELLSIYVFDWHQMYKCCNNYISYCLLLELMLGALKPASYLLQRSSQLLNVHIKQSLLVVFLILLSPTFTFCSYTLKPASYLLQRSSQLLNVHIKQSLLIVFLILLTPMFTFCSFAWYPTLSLVHLSYLGLIYQSEDKLTKQQPGRV